MTLPQVKLISPVRMVEPFDHVEWLFELKHDGFTAVAYVSGGQCQLVSRKNYAYKSFARLQTTMAQHLRVKNAILDGEIVCLDQDGRSIF
jgi:bifunctional non-homologous end joining protein LigD